jgi:hypothetical protein
MQRPRVNPASVRMANAIQVEAYYRQTPNTVHETHNPEAGLTDEQKAERLVNLKRYVEQGYAFESRAQYPEVTPEEVVVTSIASVAYMLASINSNTQEI